uniref:NADH-ubiquinone oxidoreductase chain 2 n=1 Tax=Meyerozyma guilliermondii TaxID=4929 RepID=S5U3T0_PICGM|nr:NADH dehydrogenase subunit 2 [Meyerozyma guilliermondii]AGS44078.1 NADH dehydrogenase subunit 2 [Meyerozyma guilliermondii]
MLFTSFLIFLVFSTFPNESLRLIGLKNSHSIIVNRLGTLTIIFTLIMLIISTDIVALSPGITLYNNWFSLTPTNLPIIYLILSLVIILLIYTTSNQRYDLKSPYYLLLLLANIIGLLLFPLVNDLLSLYVVIELQSYSLYLLTGLHNRSYNASRASLLYFLMGGIASTIILISSYFIYALTGTTNISDIMIFYSYSNAYDYFDILLIALLFKMGMAPLHRWSIAVYNYAPTYITAYISIVAKLSIVSWIFSNASLFHHHILIIFFYLSLFIAAYKPLFQVNIKTILAYSGLLNFGYILLTIISYDSSLYIYLIQYVLTHLILFLGILSASEYINNPISKWSPLLYIHQLKLPNLTLALCLILALFSLIGIPPLPGFYAKYYILSAALQDNYIIETITIVICSVIATYYYANIIKVLMTSKTNKVVNYINPSLAYTIALSTTLLISFFIYLPAISEGLYLITI